MLKSLLEFLIIIKITITNEKENDLMESMRMEDLADNFCISLNNLECQVVSGAIIMIIMTIMITMTILLLILIMVMIKVFVIEKIDNGHERLYERGTLDTCSLLGFGLAC